MPEERRHRWRHFFRLLTSYFASNQLKVAWPIDGVSSGLEALVGKVDGKLYEAATPEVVPEIWTGG